MTIGNARCRKSDTPFLVGCDEKEEAEWGDEKTTGHELIACCSSLTPVLRLHSGFLLVSSRRAVQGGLTPALEGDKPRLDESQPLLHRPTGVGAG